jgi:Sec7-like guanine-nucleotide exchange factor
MLQNYLLALLLIVTTPVFADCCCDLQLPEGWQTLKPSLSARIKTNDPKLRLSDAQIDDLLDYLEKNQDALPELKKLQNYMPNKTLQLLLQLQSNKSTIAQANKIAQGYILQIKGKSVAEIVASDISTE